MTTQKLTIHRALSELKLLDARITKSIADLNPSGIFQKSSGKIGGIHLQDDFKKTAEANFQSVQDLIARKQKIKTKIVESNSVTKVTVGSKTMTVADAITEKDAIASKQLFVDTLNARLKKSMAFVNKNNEAVKTNLQTILEKSFGKDNVQSKKEDVDAISKPFMEANEYILFDPLDLAKKVEALQNEIDNFKAEVDATLSESNAISFIEI